MGNVPLESITLGEAWGWLIAAAAALVTLSKAWDFVASKFKPQRELRKTVSDMQKKLDEDKKRLDKQEEANGVIFRALYAQINHELSGNGDDILRKSRDEIQDYLTNR